MVVTFTPARGLRPAGSASTRSPALASPSSEIGIELRTRLSTGASQPFPAPSISTTPSSCSSRAGSFFIGWARQPAPASSVRASTRSPALSALPLPFSTRRSRGGGKAPPDSNGSGDQLSGTAMASPSSISMTRSTVTRGTPPMRWNARFSPSISPSSAMSRSSALSAIFSCPLSPNSRAISRLPAGVGERATKSRICLRVGRPGLGLVIEGQIGGVGQSA